MSALTTVLYQNLVYSFRNERELLIDMNALSGAHRENKLEKRFTLFTKAVVCIIPDCTRLASYPHFTSEVVFIFRTDSFDAQNMNVLLLLLFFFFFIKVRKQTSN